MQINSIHSEITQNQATNTSNLAQGTLNGRSYTHWSYYIFMTGTVVGLVALVAAAILTNYIIITAGSAFFLFNALASYYIKKFSLFKNLDDQVKKITSEMQQYKDRNQELEKLNDALTKIDKNMSLVPGKFAKVIKDGDKEIDEDIKNIKDLTAQLKSSEQELSQIAIVAVDINNSLGAIGTETNRLSDNENNLHKSLELLLEDINKLQKTITTFRAEVETLSGQTVIYTRLNEIMGKQIGLLRKALETLQLVSMETSKKIQLINVPIESLNKLIPQAANSASKVLSSTQDIKTSTTALYDLDTKIKQKIEEIRKWKETKEGKEYIEFKKWRKTQNGTTSSGRIA